MLGSLLFHWSVYQFWGSDSWISISLLNCFEIRFGDVSGFDIFVVVVENCFAMCNYLGLLKISVKNAIVILMGTVLNL